MSIALSIGNNLTTGGVFTADAVNNTSVTNVTDFASVPGGGVLKLLSTQTASASATIDFTSGIDSTYDSYVFKFYDIHPSTNSANFTFQADTGTNTNYNLTITSTSFEAYHTEADDDTGLTYNATRDQAQGTAFAHLGCGGTSSDNDSSMAGTLQIFNPSSSTYVKHYIAVNNTTNYDNLNLVKYVAGYGNTTSPVDAIKFQMSSGNIDSGQILLFGVN